MLGTVFLIALRGPSCCWLCVGWSDCVRVYWWQLSGGDAAALSTYRDSTKHYRNNQKPEICYLLMFHQLSLPDWVVVP